MICRPAMLAAVCGVAALSSCGGQELDREAWVNLQSLGTTWTGPWGSDTQGSTGPIGVTGESGADEWLYAERSGTLCSTTRPSDDNSSWRCGLTNVAISGRPAASDTFRNSGNCAVVAWRNSSGTMTWQVESVAASGLCELNHNLFAPSTISGSIDAAPAVASYDDGTTQVYWAFAGRTSDGALLYRSYAATGSNRDFSGTWSANWGAKTDRALKAGSSPAAVSWSSQSFHIFIRGTDDNLYIRSLNLSPSETWGSWTSLGFPVDYPAPFADVTLASDPSVGSRGFGMLDVCVLGSDIHVYCRSYASGSWGAWTSKGSPSGGGYGAPAVTTDGTDAWVFVKDSSGFPHARAL